ncbi:MAG: ATP-binding cassette domain-containing protein [Akkermansia sp.]
MIFRRQRIYNRYLSLSTVKRLFRYYYSYSEAKVLIILILMIQYGVSVAAPFVFGALIGGLSRGEGYSTMVITEVLLLFGLNAADILASRLYCCRLEKETARMALRLKMQALNVYHRMDEETRSSRSPAEWEHRIAADSMAIAASACPLFSSLIGAIIVFLLTLGVVMADKPVFILPALACFGMFLILLRLRRARLHELNQQCRLQSYREYTTLLDILSLKSVMRVFRAVPFLSRRYQDDAAAYCRSHIDSACYTAAYTSEIRLLIWLTDSVVLVLSLYLFFTGVINLDSLIAYGLLLSRLTQQLGQMLFSIPQFSRGDECAAAMDEYRRYECCNKAEARVAEETPALKPNELLRFVDAGFSYRGQQRAIVRGLNASVCAGEYISVMGRNGEGKSTLVKLLLGELVPTQGAVLSQVKRPGYVPQNIAVFRGSLRDNLTLCNHTISESALEKVIRTTHLTALAERIGLDNEIAQEQLSGGELQRIGIARALIVEPDLLVVDEITNHLDIVNKELIFSMLKDLQRSCTIIAISHDAEAFEDSDRCLLLQGGTLTPLEGGSGEEKRLQLHHLLIHETNS